MRSKIVVCVVVLLGATTVGLLALHWQSLMISYHKSRRLAEYRAIYDIGPQGDQGPHIENFERHQNSLVRLGYFSHESIPLVHIGVPSPENKMLFHALNACTPIEKGYFEISGYNGDTAEVRLWGSPTQLRLMKRVVADHDMSPKRTEPSAPADGP